MANSGRRDIQSLANGIDILDLLVDSDRPLGVTEIAQTMNLDKSTIHRLLSTLAGRSYIVQQEETRRYMPSLKIISMSRKLIDRISLRSIAKSYLAQLTKTTGESSNLAIRTGDRITYIDSQNTDAPLSVQAEIGQEAPMHCTALGKALLAHFPADRIVEIIQVQEFARFTPQTITTMDELLPHLEMVKNRGYSSDLEEYNFGVSSIASPIFDHRNIVVASIGISGPSMRITSDRIPLLATYVVDAAHQISLRIGQKS
ncbi:MAG: IclR family transcriptional regulator [Anaerolineaceae bacterium]|nr:IclR family transcriptional regulator [Anaerolineaceae bacterium]